MRSVGDVVAKAWVAGDDAPADWSLSLCNRKWDLLGEARPDVVVGAHTEGVEAQRLLALAGHGNHDRGPFDLVRLATG